MLERVRKYHDVLTPFAEKCIKSTILKLSFEKLNHNVSQKVKNETCFFSLCMLLEGNQGDSHINGKGSKTFD